MEDIHDIQNLTNATGDMLSFFDELKETDRDILLILVYTIIFVVAVFGNIGIMSVVIGNSRMRNSTNTLLCNLAFADLSVSLICVPMAVGQALYRVWIYGEFMCKITTYLQGVTVAASIFTITVLSVDRYLAIKHPIIFRRISRTGVALKFIILIWIVSMGIMAPLIFMRQVDTVMIIPEEPIYLCTEIWPEHFHRQIFDVFLFVIVYIVPGFIICLSYGCIGKELWKEDRSLQRTESHISQGIGNHVMTGRKRVAKMLIALAILFAVCWCPYYVVNLYLDFSKEYARSFLKVLPFAILLGHSNSAFNPILYFYSSKSFRKNLYRTLKCRKRASKRNFAVRYAQQNIRLLPATPTSRPKLRIISSSSFTRTRSSGGSFKFSRSSNTSLKSTSGRSFETRLSFRDKLRDRGSFRDKTTARVEKIPLSAPVINVSIDVKEKDTSPNTHKREIFERTLSIPTTINEESSRAYSVTPARPLSPFVPLISKVPETGEDGTIDHELSPCSEKNDEKDENACFTMV